MKVFFLNEPLEFYAIPRVFPKNDEVLTLILKNEFTGATIEPETTFLKTSTGLKITLSEQPEDFKELNKYEVIIKINEIPVYFGKSIVLKSGSDVQNYETKNNTNARFKFK